MVDKPTPTPVASSVQRYWDAVAKRLRLESMEMAGLIRHNGERGTANELSVGTLLRRLLPPSVRVASGEIIDGHGGVSPQVDTVLLSNNHPLIFAQTEEKLFPVESVILGVEVKTTLTTDEMKDVAGKVKKFKRLENSIGGTPAIAVFAHKAGSAPKTVANWFFDLPEEERPAFFLVNDSALAGVLNSSVPGGYEITMPFSPRAGELDTYGFNDPMTRDRHYWKPVDEPLKEQVRIDHGVAMLVFLRQVLRVLSSRNHAEIEWLNTYFDQIPQRHVRYASQAPAVLVQP